MSENETNVPVEKKSEEQAVNVERLKVKILRPFMHNGTMLKVGDEVEMEFKRACRHMRVGDVERNEEAIAKYKDQVKAEAEAQTKAANADW